MKALHKTIGVAIGFSPNSRFLFKEAVRLRQQSDADLIIIHAGTMDAGQKALLKNLIEEMKVPLERCFIEEEDKSPEQVIKDICRKRQIDLLILGALVKEDFFSYYTGSVARNVMRDVPCSLFILTPPNREYAKICATVDFSTDAESLVRYAYETALLCGSQELILLREFMMPGLAITVNDSGASSESQFMRLQWEANERTKLEMLIKELNLTAVKVTPVIVYGKEGFEASAYAKSEKVDLLIVPAQKRKLKLLDRLFPHDQEFLFKELPCSLICYKNRPNLR